MRADSYLFNLTRTVAIRIIRSAQEIGWDTVAIYTDNDSSHATFADDAIKLDNVSKFMDVGFIIETARQYVDPLNDIHGHFRLLISTWS